MRIGIFLLLKIFIISCYIPVEAKKKIVNKISAEGCPTINFNVMTWKPFKWVFEGDYCVVRYKREAVARCRATSCQCFEASCRSGDDNGVSGMVYSDRNPKEYERLKRIADSGTLEKCSPPFETHGKYCVMRVKRTHLR